MTRKKLILESGQSFIAQLYDNKTAKLIYHSLLLESVVTHSRRYGR